jgi:hypothetical protein
MVEINYKKILPEYRNVDELRKIMFHSLRSLKSQKVYNEERDIYIGFDRTGINKMVTGVGETILKFFTHIESIIREGKLYDVRPDAKNRPQIKHGFISKLK